MQISLGRCLRGTCMCITILFFVAIYLAFFVYEMVEEGELVLDRAPGVVTISREADTKILHIKGDDWKSISYGQGFACAQDRLWQMEKHRRMAKGTLAEKFGKEALVIDEFMRYIDIAGVS